VAVNLILIGLGIVLGLWVLARLRIVVVPVLVALLLATFLVPPVEMLRQRNWPSAVATFAVMLAAILGLAAVIWLIVPLFVDQFDQLETTVDEGVEEVIRWLVQGPLDLERAEIDEAVEDGLDSVRAHAGDIGQGVLSGASLLLELIAGLLLLIVLVFFFVHDGRRMWQWGVSLAPERHRELIDGAGHEVWRSTSGYMRGVAVIAVVDAVLIGIALAIIGVPLVVPLMVVVFLGAFVPLIGATVAGAIAALVALISEGLLAAGLVVGAIVAIQQIEGDLLYPNIVGRVIRLHPVAILLVLTAGTVVAGLLGALLAVPVGAAIWTAVDYVRRQRDPDLRAERDAAAAPG
jgi:predicted PurR-regulated permease PerM